MRECAACEHARAGGAAPSGVGALYDGRREVAGPGGVRGGKRGGKGEVEAVDTGVEGFCGDACGWRDGGLYDGFGRAGVYGGDRDWQVSDLELEYWQYADLHVKAHPGRLR